MSFNNFVNSLRNIDLSSVEIEINGEFCRSKCGILKILQVVSSTWLILPRLILPRAYIPQILGFICITTILVSCSNNDSNHQIYSGFVGGKTETAFLLIVWPLMMWSTLLLGCYLFSIHMSSVIPKTILVLN